MLNMILKLLHRIIILSNLWLKLQEWIYDVIVMICVEILLQSQS